MIIPAAEAQSPVASQVGITISPLVQLQRDGSEKLSNFPQGHTAFKWWSLDYVAQAIKPQSLMIKATLSSLMLFHVLVFIHRPSLHTCDWTRCSPNNLV